jgi:hypothetical protein
VEQLEFLNVLLGDRPALTRAENFYQRILAGDLDEVEDQAESALNDLPLTSYYDDVVMKALELAAHDAARGVLKERHLAQIKAAVIELATELDHLDQKHNARKTQTELREAPPVDAAAATIPETDTRSPSVKPICTIAAHTQLDEIAAFILAQLLRRQGVQVQVLAKDAVSRAAIAHFDPKDARILCICCVDDFGKSSHLRFLLRRLRQRVPEACLMALVWPSDHPVLRDGSLRASLGADQYLSSLQHAIETCLKAIEEEHACKRPFADVRITSNGVRQAL